MLLSNPSYSDLPAGLRHRRSVVVFEPFSTRASSWREFSLPTGLKVDPRNWRTIIVAQVGTEVAPDGTLQPVTCSGTLVGPGVFLTAAHCLDGGATAGLRPAVVLKVGGLDLNTQCLVAKGYRDAVAAKVWDGDIPRVSDDYALCHFDPPALLPSDLQNLAYEVIDATQSLVVPLGRSDDGFGMRGDRPRCVRSTGEQQAGPAAARSETAQSLSPPPWMPVRKVTSCRSSRRLTTRRCAPGTPAVRCCQV